MFATTLRQPPEIARLQEAVAACRRAELGVRARHMTVYGNPEGKASELAEAEAATQRAVAASIAAAERWQAEAVALQRPARQKALAAIQRAVVAISEEVAVLVRLDDELSAAGLPAQHSQAAVEMAQLAKHIALIAEGCAS